MPLNQEQIAEMQALENELSMYSGLSPEEMEEAASLEQSLGEEGFFTKLKGDYQKRESEAAAAAARGEMGAQSKFETEFQKMGAAGGFAADVGGRVIGEGVDLLSSVDDFSGGYGKKTLGAAVSAVGKLPSYGGGTIGESLPQEIIDLSNKYEGYKKENPRGAANLESILNVTAILAPWAKRGESFVDSVVNTGKTLKRKNINKLDSKQLNQAAGDLYKKADELGAKVDPEFWNDYIKDVKRNIKKSEGESAVEGALGVESRLPQYIQNLSEIAEDAGSYSAIKKADEALNSLYYQADKAGDGLAARELLIMRDTLRDSVDKSEKYFKGNTKEAFKVAKEAKKLYAASRRMDDVERIIQQSIGAQQPSTVLKNGFRRLRDSKDFKFYTPEEQFAIKKAAKTGKIEGFFKLSGSGLGTSIFGIGTGIATGNPLAGLGAAGVAYGARETSKGIAESMAGRKAKNVLSSIQATAQNTPQPYYAPYVNQAVKESVVSGVPAAALGYARQETMEEKARRIFKRKK